MIDKDLIEDFGIHIDDWIKLNALSNIMLDNNCQIISNFGMPLYNKSVKNNICWKIQGAKGILGKKKCRTCHSFHLQNDINISKKYTIFTCFTGISQFIIRLSDYTAILGPPVKHKIIKRQKLKEISEELGLPLEQFSSEINQLKTISEKELLSLAQLIESILSKTYLKLKNANLEIKPVNHKQKVMDISISQPNFSTTRPHYLFPHRHRRRVVITGLGVICSIGTGKEKFLDGLREGRSGITSITHFDASDCPSKIAGYLSDFNPKIYFNKEKKKPKGRASQLAVAAAKMAFSDSGLVDGSFDRDRMGVYIGSSASGMEFAEEQFERFLGDKKVSPWTAVETFGGATSNAISYHLGLNGPSVTFTNGCTSGTDSIGTATQWIRNNCADIIVAGGVEAHITKFIVNSFCSSQLLSKKRNHIPEKACRPFDKDRDGMVMAEGSGMLIIEDLDHALSRGAPIYGEILGYAASGDAFNPIRSNGVGAVKSMAYALQDAGVGINDVDAINAHGTSTILNDKIETEAIKNYFEKQAYNIPVTAMKSMIGHTESASGSIEIIGSLLSMQDGFIPPTINYEETDPECDLDYVPNVMRESDIDIVLKNSFAFGGKNACLVIGRY